MGPYLLIQILIKWSVKGLCTLYRYCSIIFACLGIDNRRIQLIISFIENIEYDKIGFEHNQPIALYIFLWLPLFGGDAFYLPICEKDK